MGTEISHVFHIETNAIDLAQTHKSQFASEDITRLSNHLTAD